MKAGKSNYDVGTKIKITKISDEDSKDLEGIDGELTHPFGCFPANYVGVYLDQKQADQMGFINAICNLSKSDKFVVITD